MSKIRNRIDNLILYKGLNHSYRIINIKIVRINVDMREIEVDVAAVRKMKYISPEFFVDPAAIITTNNNKIVSLSEIKPGSQAVIDFIKLEHGQQLVNGITILR